MANPLSTPVSATASRLLFWDQSDLPVPIIVDNVVKSRIDYHHEIDVSTKGAFYVLGSFLREQLILYKLFAPLPHDGYDIRTICSPRDLRLQNVWISPGSYPIVEKLSENKYQAAWFDKFHNRKIKLNHYPTETEARTAAVQSIPATEQALRYLPYAIND